MERCRNCQRLLDSTGACTNAPRCARAVAQQRTRISPADLLFAAAAIEQRCPVTMAALDVFEAAFYVTALIDVEIRRTSANPEQQEQMLSIIAQHIDERLQEVRNNAPALG